MKLNLKIIIISTINIIILNNVIGSNYFITIFNNTSFIFPLIIGTISILMVLLIPPLSKNIYTKILKSKIFRFIISTYIFVLLLSIFLTSFYIISERFFFLTPTYLIVAFSMFFIFISLKANCKTIINILLVVSIFIILISSFHLFNSYPTDYKLLSFNFDNLSTSYKALITIPYVLDIIILLIIPINLNKVSKKDLIISIIIGSTISSLLIMENFTYITYTFYQGINFPSLYRFRLYSGPKYIEHFDNFLSLIISLFIISKAIFYLELFRIFLHIKKTITYRLFISIFLGLITCLLFYNITFSNNIVTIFSIILTILLFIIYLSLWRYRTNGKYKHIE